MPLADLASVWTPVAATAPPGTPDGGAACLSVARVALSVVMPWKPGWPPGWISANVVCRSFETYAVLPVVKKSL